jgi:pimeloyl-ACP methyl ester carboxylesterase
MPLVQANDVRLLVQESGSGDPLVLVHGSWDDRQVWMFVEEELAKSFRVTSYDRRGHTGSQDGSSPGTRQDDEDDLAALIEASGRGPVHLVANSFGTSIALGLATRRPELVRSLCGHEPPLLRLAADHPAVAEVGARIGPVLELIERDDNEAAARMFVDEVAVGPGAWDMMQPEDQASMAANAGTFADEQRDPAWSAIDLDALAIVRFPVLLTQGDQSPPFFAAINARLAEAMPSAQVQTIPGTGHIPHITHPAEWLAVVREFAGRS